MFKMSASLTVDLFNVNSGEHKGLVEGICKLLQISVAFSLFDLRAKPTTDVIVKKNSL